MSRHVHRNLRVRLQCNLERRTDLISKCSQVKRNVDVLVVFISNFLLLWWRCWADYAILSIHRFITNKSQRLLFASGVPFCTRFSRHMPPSSYTHARDSLEISLPTATRLSLLGTSNAKYQPTIHMHYYVVFQFIRAFIRVPCALEVHLLVTHSHMSCGKFRSPITITIIAFYVRLRRVVSAARLIENK